MTSSKSTTAKQNASKQPAQNTVQKGQEGPKDELGTKAGIEGGTTAEETHKR